MMEDSHPDGRRLPEIWMIAAMLEVCPRDVRDAAYQCVDEVGEDYIRLRHKIIMWTSNRVAAATRDGPVPMEIGGVTDHQDMDEEGPDVPLDYVRDAGRERCFQCGGDGTPGGRLPVTLGKFRYRLDIGSVD